MSSLHPVGVLEVSGRPGGGTFGVEDVRLLGTFAAHTLLRTKEPISRLRGRFHDYHGVPLMPTFHPAFLLRDPRKKREVWEDMKKVRDYLKSPT